MTQNGEKIQIEGDYITLGQLLKFLRLVSTGGEEKAFLAMHEVTFNGEKEIRRGKKLRPGDIITIDEERYEICTSNP